MTGFNALPGVEDSTDSEYEVQWEGVSKILGPRWFQLPTLTIGFLGVQVMWSVEMSYASPYLLQLGLTKSLMAIVFLAGPLSGLIVQPLIGVITDNSKSRFGRRRPYIIFGVIICCFSMLLLGFTRHFASIFVRSPSWTNDILTIVLAIWALLCIDFSINAVQAVDRALLVDTLPSEKQAAGNAWAARMLGIGSVVGFFVGESEIDKLLPFMGHTQLEVLAVIASFLLVTMHLITTFCVKEKVLISSSRKRKGLKEEFQEIWENISTLPPTIRQICIIQFFAWIAWFPVLFYTTVYIGDLHKRVSPVPIDEAGRDALDDEATRLGSRALFFNSLVSLAATFIMPMFILNPDVAPEGDAPPTLLNRIHSHLKMHLCELWAFSHLLFALCMVFTFFTSSVWGATLLITVLGFSWAITQWAPFSLLAEEILSDEPSPIPDDTGSIRLMDSRTHRPSLDPRTSDADWHDTGESQHLMGNGDNDHSYDSSQHKDQEREREHDRSDDDESWSRASSMEEERPSPLMKNDIARRSHAIFHEDGLPAEVGPSALISSTSDEHEVGGVVTGGSHAKQNLKGKAGVILGIHNLFIVVPQFLVTGISSIIFALVDPEKSVSQDLRPHPGGASPVTNITMFSDSARLFSRDPVPDSRPNSVAIIFRIGGVTAAVAFILSWRLAKELKSR